MEAPRVTSGCSRVARDHGQRCSPARCPSTWICPHPLLRGQQLLGCDHLPEAPRWGARRAGRPGCVDLVLQDGVAQVAGASGSGPAGPPGGGRCPRTRSGSGWPSPGRGGAGAQVSPSTVTWRSSMHSRRALCVRGVARLISSARSDVGARPGRGGTRTPPSSGCRSETPVTSLGSRSGVNWIRLKVPPREVAKARASIVFPVPGTSSKQDVALHQQGHGDQIDHLALADDHPLDVLGQTLAEAMQPGQALRRAASPALQTRSASCGDYSTDGPDR